MTALKSFPRAVDSKIQDPVELKKKIVKGQGSNHTFVFTNGCFDLLHKGHISYLNAARREGDRLIVALNNDDSVRQLKGPSRPLNSLADRMEVIAALECVDFVTWFDDETPLKLIIELRPDVLVKGGDWAADKIIGAAEVLAHGGKVKSLSYVDGKSTTRLIELARKN